MAKLKKKKKKKAQAGARQNEERGKTGERPKLKGRKEGFPSKLPQAH
jgi:hypothetical protein